MGWHKKPNNFGKKDNTEFRANDRNGEHPALPWESRGVLQDKQKYRIGVVGVGRGAGTTFLASSIARLIAETGQTAAYIECSKPGEGEPLLYDRMCFDHFFRRKKFHDFLSEAETFPGNIGESGRKEQNGQNARDAMESRNSQTETRVNLCENVNWIVYGKNALEKTQIAEAEDILDFTAIKGKYLILDSPKLWRKTDLLIGVIDPLPSRVLAGLDTFEALKNEEKMGLQAGKRVLWVLNKNNAFVDRSETERFLKLEFDFAVSMAELERFYGAEFACGQMVLPADVKREIRNVVHTILEKLPHFSI